VLLSDSGPVFLKGVNWNPVPPGGVQANGGVNFRGYAEVDSELMAAAGINAVRTYEPITDREVLDVFHRKGIHVLNTIYIEGDAEPDSVVPLVKSLKDHPAILMWVIGNEWNFNMLYSDMTPEDASSRVQEVARLVKKVDPLHLVATVYGMVPGSEEIDAQSDIDVWGINVYSGLTFGPLFADWEARSTKPMFLAEFGADAFNANTGEEDEEDQAKATRALFSEMLDNSVQSGGTCLGGFIFELADEWWKDDKGSPSTHDRGGIAPGGGPFPDNTFNEEFWGIVQIDGTPRMAYKAYAEMSTGFEPRSPRPALEDIVPGYRLRACGASPRCAGHLGNCCPTADGLFRDCCSSDAVGDHDTGEETPAPAPAPKIRPHSQQLPPALDLGPTSGSTGKCNVNHPVPCCQDGGSCGVCSGDQCCAGDEGSVTCPSASTAHVEGCIKPKLYDCTGETGIEAPSTTTAQHQNSSTRERHSDKATSTTPIEYSCDFEGEPNWRNGWSDMKKAWCCKKHGVACATGPKGLRRRSDADGTTTLAPFYNCSAPAEEQERWSSLKRAWCRVMQGSDEPEAQKEAQKDAPGEGGKAYDPELDLGREGGAALSGAVVRNSVGGSDQEAGPPSDIVLDEGGVRGELRAGLTAFARRVGGPGPWALASAAAFVGALSLVAFAVAVARGRIVRWAAREHGGPYAFLRGVDSASRLAA